MEASLENTQIPHSEHLDLSRISLPAIADESLRHADISGSLLIIKAKEIAAARQKAISEVPVLDLSEKVTITIEDNSKVNLAEAQTVEKESFYFLNGVQTILVEQKLETHWISKTYNCKYTLCSNEEQNIAVDVGKSLGGLVSNRLGCYLEGDLAEPLSMKIIADLASGTKVNLAGHSQGGIAIHNILGEIQRATGEDWWNKHSHLITVKFYAVTIEDWPKGVKATGYIQEDDWVAYSAGTLSKCSTWSKSWFGREYTKAKIITIPGDEHAFYSYMKSEPAFFVQDFLDRNNGNMDGVKLAKEVHNTIKLGNAYGSETYTSLIEYCVDVGGEKFCATIKPHLVERDQKHYIESVFVKKGSVQRINSCIPENSSFESR